jgi:acetyl-CoA C-acetyltransferase
MAATVIVAGARTPIGKMSGALSSQSAAELGGVAIAEALRRAGIQPDQVDHVIMGQVLMAGQGQVPARQAAVNAGIPMRVPSVTSTRSASRV